ncbi:MAG: hypothetical protein QOE70_699 [Chthoniobacter sp.]|nr:hypothetical protein [Chthoniobacter sp.]
MKILFASSSSGSRGGGETFLLYLGRALAERGHEMTLWTSDHPRMDEAATAFADFGRVVRARYRNTYDRLGRSLSASFDRSAARRAAADWRGCSPDIVHINKQNLEDGLDLLSAAPLLPVPALCTIHLTQTARYLRARLAPIRDWVARRALRRFPGPLVTVLEGRRSGLADFVGDARRVHTVPNGVPLFDLTQREILRRSKRAELDLAETDLLVIGTGRLVAQKRPGLFLEHAAAIRRAVPNAKFLWVGDGPLAEEWDRRAAELGIAEVAHRAGWQTNVAPFFAAADLLLHVAEFEGLPLALLEAMSAELPCAVSANLRSEMPFLTPSNSFAASTDPRDLASLSNPAARRSRGRLARELVEREFSFEKMAGDYEALYRSIHRAG